MLATWLVQTDIAYVGRRNNMERLTEKDAYWFGEEFWTSAKEPDDEEIDNVYMKLKEYEDLEEQGLLLKLQCKVGDEVYRINKAARNPIIPLVVT